MLPLPNATCEPPTTLSELPRILVVVPGHGEPARSHVVEGNLHRIALMRVVTTCLMFTYGTKISDETLALRFPSCRVLRQDGYWMHHLRGVPIAEVQRVDYVLLMIDGVEMNPDVDLRMLAHVMETNCLRLAGPSCGSCKSKQLIRPMRDDPQYTVGRRVDYLDPQIQMYTRDAFLCLQVCIRACNVPRNRPSRAAGIMRHACGSRSSTGAMHRAEPWPWTSSANRATLGFVTSPYT